MTQARFAPEALTTLDAAVARDSLLGQRLDEAIDWIEADPPDQRARRRAWAGGVFGIDVHAGGEDWLILWKALGQPFVMYVGPPL